MKKKRERFEVIHDILKTVQVKREIGPTRLLQLSNLSPQMFKDYISDLVDADLISENTKNRKKLYSLSDNGHIFLERYAVFSNFIEKLGL